MKMSRYKLGFTLIELIIVMAVIGIMSGAIISVLDPALFRGKARDSRRRTDLTEMQGALEMYYSDNYHYPVYAVTPVRLESITELEAYTTSIPQDPVSGSYYYISNEDGSDYELNAEFESQDMTSDGGDDANRYEVGTDLTLR